MHLLSILPCDFDLWPIQPKTTSLLRYPKVIPYAKFEYYESFVFELCSDC